MVGLGAAAFDLAASTALLSYISFFNALGIAPLGAVSFAIVCSWVVLYIVIIYLPYDFKYAPRPAIPNPAACALADPGD